ncbi:MAG: response regulator [Mariprofundaceae bacterium]
MSDKRILIVDDNQLNLELAADVLEMHGFEVATAGSGQEGVERARQWRPDLILMDLRMPEISGLDALQMLKADEGTKDVPVAVLTASAMKGDEERLLNSGFSAYLSKPIDPSNFADEVTAVLEASK